MVRVVSGARTLFADLDMVADGMTVAEIIADFPDLEAADVEEALRYAAEAVRERGLPLRHPA